MSQKKRKTPVNPLCLKCIRHCKQNETTLLVDCPRFQPYPFKIEKRNYEQLGLFGNDEQE
ncbi:MAG: hypothetical protein GWN87_13690 [Desulfuromonadales bacterium]|nr:hypothetical protein [Desulfuromonadales bacterium]